MSIVDTIMYCSEPTKERVERTIISITAIEIPIPLASVCYSCYEFIARRIRGVTMSPHYFLIPQAQDDLQQWIAATDTLGAICCSHNVASS